MRRERDGIGRGQIGLRLLAVSVFALLSGCGWLFGDDTPKGNARPGVDRKAPATGTLPAASGQHDGGLAPIDPVGSSQVGSIVPGKGGQKAQKEAADKEAADRDSKEREERQKREADEREAKAKEQQEEGAKESPKATPEKRSLPGKPAAAEWGNPDNRDRQSTPPDSAAPKGAASGATPAAVPAPGASSPAAPAPAAPAPATAPVRSAPVAPAPAAPPPSAAPVPDQQPAQPPRT